MAMWKKWHRNCRVSAILIALTVPYAMGARATAPGDKPQSDTLADSTSVSHAKTDKSVSDKSAAKNGSVESLFNGVPILPATAVMPIQFSYTPWNNSLMSALLLVDNKPQQCIFVTGLNACTLTPDLAVSYKLVSLTSKIDVATFNGTRNVPETEIKNLRLSSVSIAALRVGILDASELYMGQSEPGAPGLWLGTPFLAAFQVTIDYENHIIKLDRPDAPLPKDKSAVVLPLDIREGRLYTRVTIPDVGKFSALIDTGTMGTLIPTSIATKLKIAPIKTLVIKRADGRIVEASLIMLPKVQVGRIEQERVPALYFVKDTEKAIPSKQDIKTSPAKSSINKASLSADTVAGDNTKQDNTGKETILKETTPKEHAKKDVSKEVSKKEKSEQEAADYNMAVLGNDFLKHYQVIFNFSKHQLILIPPRKVEEVPTPDPANVKKPDKPVSKPKNPRNKAPEQLPPPQTNSN